MADTPTVERQSALAGHYNTGKFGLLGADDTAGVILQDMHNLVLHQVAAWPDSLDQAGKLAASAVGVSSAPGPCRAEGDSNGALLRIEPLKWWLFGAQAPDLEPETGATLDLSHSRTHIRITGQDAATFLNRLISLDLREDAFPIGAVGSTVTHHVGVTLWRSAQG